MIGIPIGFFEGLSNQNEFDSPSVFCFLHALRVNARTESRLSILLLLRSSLGSDATHVFSDFPALLPFLPSRGENTLWLMPEPPLFGFPGASAVSAILR